MKIAVLGCARTGTSALCQQLKIKNDPIILLQESINISFESKVKLFSNIYQDKELFERKIREHLIKEHNSYLQGNFSYIIKFLGHHFTGMGKLLPEMKPALYDQIHLIERKNLWDQICSHCVASNENHWLANEIKPSTLIRQKQVAEKSFQVDKSIIERTAWDLCNYIEMKRYLIDNNVDFSQHYYEDDEFQKEKIGPYHKNFYDYGKMITNYDIGEQIVSILMKHISIENLKFDYGAIHQELEQLTIFCTN